jgi:hypothetical protein
MEKSYQYKRRLHYGGSVFLPFDCPHCKGTGQRAPEEDLYLSCYDCNGTGTRYDPPLINPQIKICAYCREDFKHWSFTQSDPRFLFFPYDYQGDKKIFLCCLDHWTRYKAQAAPLKNWKIETEEGDFER